MADPNITITLKLNDSASGKLKDFTSLLQNLERVIGAASGSMNTLESGFAKAGSGAASATKSVEGFASSASNASSTIKTLEDVVGFLGASFLTLESKLASVSQTFGMVESKMVGLATTMGRMDTLFAQLGSSAIGGMAGVSGSMDRAGERAVAATNNISKMHEALIGMYGAEAAHKAFEAEGETVKLAADYESQKVRLRGRGLDEDQIKILEGGNAALQTANPKLNDTKALEIQGDVQKATNNIDETGKIAPIIAKLGNIADFYGGKPQTDVERNKMIDVLEQLGGTKNEESAHKIAQEIAAVIVASQGKTDASQLLALNRAAGGSMRGLSEEGRQDLYSMVGVTRQGGVVGNGFKSMINYVNGRGLSEQEIQAALEAGLLRTDQVVKNVSGGVDVARTRGNINRTGGMYGKETLTEEGPKAWIEKVLMPLLEKNTKNSAGEKFDPYSKEDRDEKLATLRNNGTFVQGVQNYSDMGKFGGNDIIGKESASQKAVKPLDDLNKKVNDAPTEKWPQFVAAMEKLGKTLGETVLPMATKFVEMITKMAEGLNSFAKDNPSAGFFAEMAVGVGAVVLAFVSWLTILGQFGAAMAVLKGAWGVIPGLFNIMKIAILDVIGGFPLLIAAAGSAWAWIVSSATAAFGALRTGAAALMSSAGIIGIFIAAAVALAAIFLFPDTVGNFNVFGVNIGAVAKNITAGIAQTFDWLSTKLATFFNWMKGESDAANQRAYAMNTGRRTAEINGRDIHAGGSDAAASPAVKPWTLDELTRGRDARQAAERSKLQTNPLKINTPADDLPSASAPVVAAKKVKGAGRGRTEDQIDASSESENAKYERAKLAIELKAISDLYRDHEIGIEGFFAKKAEAIKADTDGEVAALERRKALLEKNPAKNADQIVKVDHDIDLARMREKQSLMELEVSKREAILSLSREGLTIEEKLEGITKSASTAKIALLDQEYQKKLKIFQVNGMIAQAEALTDLHSKEVAQVQFDDQMKLFTALSAREKTDEMQAQSDRKAGYLTTAEANQTVIEAKRAQGEQELTILDTLRAQAEVIGDPTQIEHIKQMTIEAQGLADTLDEGAQKFKDAMQSGIEGALNDLQNGTFSFKKFFKGISEELNKGVSKSLSETLTGGLFGKQGGDSFLGGLLGTGKDGKGNFLTNLLGGAGKKTKDPSMDDVLDQAGKNDDEAGSLFDDGDDVGAASSEAGQALKNMTQTGVKAATDGLVKQVSQGFIQQSATQMATTALQEFTMALQSASSAVKGGGGGGGDDAGLGDSDDWMSLFDDMPSFAVGSDSLPSDMIARVHKNEMIVPASTAEKIRTGKASIGGSGNSGGGDVHQTVNFHMPAGGYDKRTQSQIGVHMGQLMQKSVRRDT